MTDVVRVAYTKWDGARHGQFDSVRLGDDDFGTWLFIPRGTPVVRPDGAFIAGADSVQLIAPGAPSTARFFALAEPPAEVVYDLYVDMITPCRWDDSTVTMIDLDLDVVRHRDGLVEVLDHDELDAHRVALGYPDHIVALAERSCADVMASIERGDEPYSSVGWSWLTAARLS